MIGSRTRTTNRTSNGTTHSASGWWRSPSGLAAALAAVAALAAAVGITPTRALAAPALSVGLAITGNADPGVPVSTLRAGGCVTVQVSYSIGGEDLANAKIKMTLPAQDWSNEVPASGRVIGLPFSGPPTNNVATENWATQYSAPDSTIELPIGGPDVPAGTVGSVFVNLCSNNGVNPNGALLNIAATLTGDNGSLAATPIAVTNYASNGVNPGNVSKTATTIVPALGPPTVNNTDGYELSWNIELASPCPNTSCVPIVGDLIDTMPAGSYLSSITRIGPITTTPVVPAPHPANGLDISAFPAAGTLFTPANQNVTVPVFIWPSICTSNSGSGAISQGTSMLPETALTGCTPEYPVSVNRRGFRVTVWVPLPVAATTITNSFSLNRDPAWDAIVSPVVKSAAFAIEGMASLTFTKSFNNSSGDCTSNAAPYQPGQAVTGDSRCTILPQGQSNDYIIRFNSTAPVADAYVIDRLPAELQLRAAPATPSGWTVLYASDPTCALSTPPNDPMWTIVLPPLTNISCVLYTNPLTDTLVTTLLVPVLVRAGQIPTPGGIALVTNSAFGTGSNLTLATADQTATRGASILNRNDIAQQVSAAPSSVVAGNQTVIRMNSQDAPFLGNFGAHNWTMEMTLPLDLDFVPNAMSGSDFRVISSPKDANAPLANLPVTCSYTAATRLVRCVATGDAVDATSTSGVGAVLFDIKFAARVRLGTSTDQLLTAVLLNDLGAPANYPAFGAVDGAGESLAYIDTPTHQGSTGAILDVISSPSLNLSKTVNGGITDVIAGDTISYTLSINHLASSTADLTNAYVYDFMGRNPATGAAIGTVAPTFVSTTVGSQPIAISYTCTVTPTIATAVWVSAPCTNVTGLRFRPSYDDPFSVTTDGLYPIAAQPLTVGVTVRAPLAATHLGVVANQAGVTSDQQPGTLLSSRPQVIVHQPADLSIVKTDTGNTGAAEGSVITYSVTVSNGNNDPLTTNSIVVTDTLPTSLTPGTASGTGWACTLSAQTFTCSRTTLVASNTALPVITITGIVVAGAPASISNTATIASPTDRNSANDQSTVATATIPPPPTATVPTTTIPTTTVPTTTAPTATTPTTAPGTTAPGTTPTTVSTTTVTTPPSAPSPATAPGPLPVTGTDAGRLLMLAACSLALGLLMLALGRRRRTADVG